MSNIKLFESKTIRSCWNESEQKWYFSVQDVVKILTDSADVKQYIKRMLSRDEHLKSNWGTICTPVEMEAADGKKRKIQATNTQGLLRIIQSIPSPKAEPFKLWLAQVGTDRLNEIENPELASTTEIARNKNAQGFIENRETAIKGGNVAGKARRDLESKSGKQVASKENFKQLFEKEIRKLNNKI